MKYILIVIALILIASGFYYYWTSSVSQPQPVDEVVSTNEASYEVFSDTNAGVQFAYKTAPNGYVVDDLSAFIGEEDTSVYQVLRVMNEREKIEMETSEGGREGPPTINIMVFENTENLTASQWVDATPRFSNIELAVGDVDRDAVVGGANAVRYQTDGLYMTDNVVVAHGEFMYHFTGSFLEPNVGIHQDFKQLIDSITFIPTTDVPTTPPGAKIDSQVACESALAYMLFRTGEDADAFVAECVAGEHPEVIERYLEGLGHDGAAI